MVSADEMFRLLGDPTRRALFERLAREGELTVSALTREAGVSQPCVSKHLSTLKQAGLVRDRPQGRQTYYAAAPEGLAPLLDWMGHYGRFWDKKMDALESLLNRMDQ